ncbi:helix-turn-helix transcriptional regulator [Ensifer sp. ENS09]|uniref:helix-turn-helix domain-containing protein n=1 Tax=Ensifer sp. ENS09 TaxID=2769263 RepID=UPI00178663CB|nr:AraC family transcriptional regulator [Ensifer sp. ENS09]MBD9650271.1 helix-turn-helix transcriptional regulator [Ensifer sp. ENS09]
MRIDALTLDGSATVFASQRIRAAVGMVGVVHHGSTFGGLELYVMLAEAEQDAKLDLLCNEQSDSLTCLFALAGHACLGLSRLEAGYGWHNHGSGTLQVHFPARTRTLVVGYRATACCIARLTDLPPHALALERPALRRTPEILISNLNLLATPPIAGHGSDIYRWGKLLEILALHAPTLALDEVREGEGVLSLREREAVGRAAQILSSNLAQPPSLSELAEAAGLSQRRLTQGFRESYGSTMFGYLREARLSAARVMLEETDMPLKQIAFHVGYGHANNFIAAYRERFGTSPRRHARKLAHG